MKAYVESLEDGYIMMSIETIYEIDGVTALTKATEKPRDNSKRKDMSWGSTSNNYDGDGDDDSGGSSRSSSSNSNDILQDANDLAKSSNWTIDFALYVMYCRAKAAGDELRAEGCMKLLEQEFMNALAIDHDDRIFLKDKKGKMKNQMSENDFKTGSFE